ncbi:MAG: N-acetyl-gamma-glutamyl-phosphate reductase [Bacteroidota bacterium]
MSQKIRASIIGGAGYTGGELIRLLLDHPQVEINWVHSNSQAGKPISDVHQDLIGRTDLRFTKHLDFRRSSHSPNDEILARDIEDRDVGWIHSPNDEILARDLENRDAGSDVLFLCLGHGRSAPILAEAKLPNELKIIDLSRDFRLGEDPDFIYGLPELNRERIIQSSRIANPGCFATAIQLALLPLAKSGHLAGDVHIHALTGSTGAGMNPLATTHFSWRNNNISIYKPFRHQHLDEIQQSLDQLQEDNSYRLNFIPLRGDFSRGIFSSIYLETELSLQQAEAMYKDFYLNHPFVHLSAVNPHLKMVVNTNNCVQHLLEDDGRLLIISMIDNLLKGASGQAVQNMNLMFGLPEDLGLKLKAQAF